MRSLVNAIRNNGLHADIDPVEIKHVVILNYCVAGIAVLMLGMNLFWLFMLPESAGVLVVGGIVLAMQFVAMYLTRVTRYRSARMVFALSGLYASVGVSLLIGPETLFHLAPLSVIVGSFAYFSPRDHIAQVVAIVLSVLTLVGLELYFQINGFEQTHSDAFVRANRYCFLLSLLGVCIAFLYYGYSTYRASELALEAEREKSEQLLLNILPEPIAKRLKDSQATIADSYDHVTILFADLVNFTPLSETMAPAEVVALLDRVFTAFDELTERHGLEKIKTIGDAYMVVSGVPVPKRDQPAAVLDMALAMQQLMAEAFVDDQLSLRVGIHSGPVVAGIIGSKKFSYDLWGDSVNTASRMESHGVPGKTQVTEAVYEAAKDDYVFSKRGEIDVKGKGPLTVWFLEGKCGGYDYIKE